MAKSNKTSNFGSNGRIEGITHDWLGYTGRKKVDMKGINKKTTMPIGINGQIGVLTGTVTNPKLYDVGSRGRIKGLKAAKVESMKSRSSSSGKSVMYDYSPGGYGNVGLAGSSAKGLGSNMYDPYEALYNMMQENTATNMYMNEQNNKFAAEQAELQRQYETEMSNTAHQREVKDLQAAGLNPVLSANAGAAVPAGAAAGASNFAGADSSAINAIAGIIEATLQSNATTTAAALNANAMMYGSDQSLQGTVYSANKSNQSARYSANRSKYGIVRAKAGRLDKGLRKAQKGIKKYWKKVHHELNLYGYRH